MGFDKREAEAMIVRLVSELKTDTAFTALSKAAREEQLLRRAIVELS
jgi:hypothetical protein